MKTDPAGPIPSYRARVSAYRRKKTSPSGSLNVRPIGHLGSERPRKPKRLLRRSREESYPVAAEGGADEVAFWESGPEILLLRRKIGEESQLKSCHPGIISEGVGEDEAEETILEVVGVGAEAGIIRLSRITGIRLVRQ